MTYIRRKFACGLIGTVIVIAVVCSVELSSTAAPLFPEPLNIEGLNVFRDHEKTNVFYYLPGDFILKTEKNQPVFRFSLIGYLGSARTQDEDTFMDKGVITFTVRENLPPEKIQRIAAALKKERVSSAVLKRAPVDGIRASLIYQQVTEGKTARQGSIVALNKEEKSYDGQQQDHQSLDLWKERTFVIPLNDLESSFFWHAFQRDQLVLSFSYSFIIPGMTDVKGEIKQTAYEHSNVLPIRIDPRQYPELFEKIDLGAKMKVGYTHVDIYCFDFVNQTMPELYGKVVEIRYKDLKGQPVVTHVEFGQEDLVYKHSVDFRYAKRLSVPYDYRVILIKKNGEKELHDWIRDNADSFLDVTTDTEQTRHEEDKERNNLY